MKILIVGAGPAGLTLANVLDPNHHQIMLIEREKSFRTLGYGLFFLNEAKKVLQELSLLPHLKSSFRNLKIANYQNRDGGLIHQLLYNKIFGLQDSQSIVSIRRKDLHNALLEHLPHNINIQRGVTIHEIENREDRVQVEFSNGKKETFDLVIGADGRNSPLRKKLFSFSVESVPWKARYLWLPGQDRRFRVCLAGPGVLMWMPMRKNTVCLILEPTRWQTSQESLANFRPFLKSNGVDMKAAQEGFDQSQAFPMVYIHTQKWFEKRVVLIGDAQHGMTPTMGYGTALALEAKNFIIE